jgi:hypothetical protein
MSDEKVPNEPREGAPGDRHARVEAAFEELREALGDRSTPETRAALEKLREALVGGDATRLRRELADVKERQGWLHAELARHPRVAELVNELALFGL